MRRNAFTMMELIFVIVIIGIIAKFGIDLLIKAYDNYTFSTVQNRLQSQTATALEEIANRLQYRIKPSVIVYDSTKNIHSPTSFSSLSDASPSLGSNAVLEWIGYDDAGLRGSWNGTMNVPDYSGFIDLNDSNASAMLSPETNTTAENDVIAALSNKTSDINDSAIFFVGGDTNVNGFGWHHGTEVTAIHPIESNATNIHILNGNFSGVTAYEFYQLAWTAYALVYTGSNSSQNIPYVNRLDDGSAHPATLFDTNGSVSILPRGLKAGTQSGEWSKAATNVYTLHFDAKDINFTYHPANGTFDCNVNDPATGTLCTRLTQ
jgi:prepilin-type N-terminal cleavage/methylation domain-containing protein